MGKKGKKGKKKRKSNPKKVESRNSSQRDPNTGLSNYTAGFSALFIVCDTYVHLPNLPCASKDGKLMQKTLESMGYKTLAYLENENVTKGRIEKEISKLMSGSDLKDGVLFVMFVGHGKLIKKKSRFCCYDFYDDKNYFTTSIELNYIREMAADIGYKHQIYYMDCCHAGGIFAPASRSGNVSPKRGGGISAFLQTCAKKPCVVGMSAVTKDEEALSLGDYGMFTKLVCDALQAGVFDENNRDWVTSQELFSFVRTRVAAFAHDHGGGKTMHPQRKDMLYKLGGTTCQGDIIFFRPGADVKKIVDGSRQYSSPTRPANRITARNGSPRQRARVTGASSALQAAYDNAMENNDLEGAMRIMQEIQREKDEEEKAKAIKAQEVEDAKKEQEAHKEAAERAKEEAKKKLERERNKREADRLAEKKKQE